MTAYERHKLLLNLSYLKSSLDIPQPSEPLDLAEVAIQNELKALQRSNDHLRKQAASLQSRNEELEAYAHTIAHDLKNPLAIIIASCDVTAYVTDLRPEELQDFLQQIRSTAYEMNTIIDNLLIPAEVRKVEAPVEPLNMARVVKNVQRRLSRMIKEYQGRITFPKTWPAASGYAPWIEEVWANYLSNALKYGGPSPRVEMGASIQPDGMVCFWTRDHGPGLTPEAQALLFAPFTQLGQLHESGHGLGLSIVRRIIDKLGGQAGVESQAGKGSLFYFTLPASQSFTESAPERGETVFRSDARLVSEQI